MTGLLDDPQYALHYDEWEAAGGGKHLLEELFALHLSQIKARILPPKRESEIIQRVMRDGVDASGRFTAGLFKESTPAVPAVLYDPKVSPYSYPRRSRPQLIVVHSTRSLDPERTDDEELWSTVNYFKQNSLQVSAHYVVSGKAEVVPCVSLDRVAQHVGMHNPISIGIELTQPLPDTPFQDGHYSGAAYCVRLVQDYLKSKSWPEIPLVRTHTAYSFGLIGHEDTEQGRIQGNSDPGRMWDWDRFIAILGEQQ